MLYQIVKTIHIMGFCTAIGISLATYVAYNRFWKLYATDNEQGVAAFRAFTYLQRIGLIGLLVVLLAGFAMLFLVDWTFFSLLWFQVKMGLVALIFVNGFTQGRTSTMQLQAFVENHQPGSISTSQPAQLKGRLSRFLILQLFIYALIIVVSVFRFA